MSFVDGRVIRQRMDAKDQRMARELKQRVRTHAEGRRTITLLREPRPEARAAGSRAFYADEPRDSNPHVAESAEWVSWDQGWWCERQANS